MSYLLRGMKMGVKTTPIIAETAGLKGPFTVEDRLPVDDEEYCFRWGTTSGINNDKIKVVNKIKSIHTTADKKAFRLKLSDLGLAPKSWRNTEELRKDWDGQSPILIRPSEHERSAGMYVCNNPWEVMDAVNATRNDFYAAQFIKKEREFRVMVVSGRIVWMIEKLPKDKNEASWGCVSDGNFEYVGWDEWPEAVVRNAIAAFDQSSLDFGAVDIIVDGEGNAYTCEINTAPYLTAYYAEKIGLAFKYIINHGRDFIPVKLDKFNWRGALHPALDKRVEV